MIPFVPTPATYAHPAMHRGNTQVDRTGKLWRYYECPFHGEDLLSEESWALAQNLAEINDTIACVHILVQFLKGKIVWEGHQLKKLFQSF